MTLPLVPITMVVMAFSTFIVTSRGATTVRQVAHNSDLRMFCLLFALPGRENDLDIKEFEYRFNTQLEKVGTSIFGRITHEQRMKEAEVVCLPQDSSTPKCAYQRIAIIGNKLIADLKSLTNQLRPNFRNGKDLYITLLSTWYMDKLFINLKCGPVDPNHPRPVVQWLHIAKLSNMLLSRQNFCHFTKALDKANSQNLRQEVKTICENTYHDPICQMEHIFDLVDAMDNLCIFVSEENWTISSKTFKYLKKAANINFLSLQSKMPTDIANMYASNNDDVVENDLIDILHKLNDDLRNNSMSLTKKILAILPKAMYLPCYYTAEFPSFKWLVCSTGKVFDELRLYTSTYMNDKKDPNILRRKVLVSEIDLREYIKNLKVSNIRELIRHNAFNQKVFTADLKNNIQHRFRQLGKYFTNVARYQQHKLKADVNYLKGRIETYQTKITESTTQLSDTVGTLIGLFIGTSIADLHQASFKLVMRIAMAVNPLKWLFGSGNVDEVLESASEIATAGRRLSEAIGSAVSFKNLLEYSLFIARKFDKNEKTIKSVKNIIYNVEKIIKSQETGFETEQSAFLQGYENYSPDVTKDDLAKLDSYWGLFIEGICNGIDSTSSIIANTIRGFGTSGGRCRKAKILASQFVAINEELYDFQFELMETMAKLMGSLTQIQSAKILGSGTKAQYPNNLSSKNIETLMAITSMSFNILQTTNVEMLCNIIEYRQGRRSSLCNGLATNIDKLLALQENECQYEFKYISVTSKRSNKTGDYSWLDLDKLYSGETVPFQVPNSKWWMEHARLVPSQRYHSFYLAAFEIYMPIISERAHSVRVHVMPTNIDNKLKENSNINYVFHPLKTIAPVSYLEGRGVACRQRQITNPYSVCGHSSSFPDICPVTYGTFECIKDTDTLLPSIYSKFYLRVEGYEHLHISKPTTDLSVQIGIRFCSVNPSKYGPHGQIERNFRGNECCSNETQYYSDITKQCEECPVGSKSYYNSLFCGEVIDIHFPDNITEVLTYNDAVVLCQHYGSTIASQQLFREARSLGQKSCVCGWLENSVVDSLSERSNCTPSVKTDCRDTGDTRYVHCAAVFTA